MKNLFKIVDAKTMLRLNLVSIFITAICVVFSLFIFLTKGQASETEHWKSTVILIGLIVVALLFLGSVASLIFFIRIKNRKK